MFHMVPGLKIGLTDWKEKLSEAKSRLGGTHLPFVEVYFRVDKKKEYEPMFSYLKSHQIKFGLHFWGVLKSGVEPNLLSRHKWICNQTYFLMREAIIAGIEQKAVYVVFHPGALRERLIDLDKNTFQLAKMKETELEEGKRNLLKNVERLQKFTVGATLQILFETLPANCPKNWSTPRSNGNILRALQCPIEFYGDLMNAGHFVANDFGHTAAAIQTVGETLAVAQGQAQGLPLQEQRSIVKNHLFDWTKKLAPSTKLIHCNLTLPPWNGVDTHSGLLLSDFAKKDVLPNRQELIELLQIFKNREDVYVLNEPEEKHVGNYLQLRKILEKIN